MEGNQDKKWHCGEKELEDPKGAGGRWSQVQGGTEHRGLALAMGSGAAEGENGMDQDGRQFERRLQYSVN